MSIKKLLCVSILTIGFVSCSNNNVTSSYTKGDEIRVTFHLNGGNMLIKNEKVTTNVSIKIDEDYFYENRFIPQRDDYQFSNWYLDEELSMPLNYSSYVVNGNIDLYARWVSPYYTYEFNENNNVNIGLNELGAAQTSISIPNYLVGYKVEGIMDYGFSSSKAKKLYTPSSITSIGYASFYGSEIQYIEFKENVNNIKHGAFVGANNLKELKIENNSKYLVHNMTLFEILDDEKNCEMHSFFNSEDTNITRRYYSDNIKIVSIAPYCFYGRKNIQSIQLPYGISEVKDYAFAESGVLKFYMNDELKTLGNGAFQDSYLNEIVIYSPLEYIGDYCFKNTLITSISIPKTIKYIGKGSLQTNILRDISLSKNDYYKLDDNGNVLECYDDLTYGLVYFNSQNYSGTVVLVNDITTIYSGAFYSLENIDTINFSGVTKVEDYLFMALDASKTIIIETFNADISKYAFYEEKRNIIFNFTALIYKDSSWDEYFDIYTEHVEINYISVDETK